MDDFSDFDAQFEATIANVSGGLTEDTRDPNQFHPSVNDKRPEYLVTGRFIPPEKGPMFVKKVVHFIKVGGKTVRVICPKTTDPRAQCEICADNIQGHRSKIPALVSRAKDWGNKTRWVANFLILEDAQNPQNVGRVMWWEFPNQIMEYIDKLKNPPDPPNPRIPKTPSINAFHPTLGADFFLCMKLVDGYTKYDGSQFLIEGGPTPIGDIEYIRQVRSMCHDIQGQIIIPSPEEISDVLRKAGSAPVVEKVYSNLGNRGAYGAPAPSVGGFAPAVPYQAVAAPQLDEFDAAYAQAGLVPPTASRPSVQGATRPTLNAGVAQAAPKPQMSVPGRPALQTAESVLPAASERVVPIPATPAAAQPHTSAPVDDDSWYK